MSLSNLPVDDADEPTDTDKILSALGELTLAVRQNRGLLNQLVSRINEVEAEVQLARQEVKSHGAAIASVEESLRFITHQRRGKLTPLPAICEEMIDAP